MSFFLRRLSALRIDTAGAAVVEFALVLPVVLLFLIGVVDFGRLFVIGIGVSGAAEAGAQYGAQTAATSKDTVGMRIAANGDYNAARLGSSITVTASSQCRCPTDDSVLGSCVNAVCGGNPVTPRVYVSVQASRTVSLLIHYPGIPQTIDVTRRAVVRAQ